MSSNPRVILITQVQLELVVHQYYAISLKYFQV